MIELSRSNTLSANPRGPHFILMHEEYVREHQGNEVIELPLDKVLSYLDEAPNDPVRREAMGRLLGNSGVGMNWAQYQKGERELSLVFMVHGSGRLQNGGIDGDVHTDPHTGEKYVSLHLLSVARILADTEPHEKIEGSAEAIHRYITEFLAQLGVKPNMERLKAEYCKTCGKKI